MAGRKDVALDEIRKVRRDISKRLARARDEDRFLDELKVLGREGREFLKAGRGNGHANGHGKKRSKK